MQNMYVEKKKHENIVYVIYIYVYVCNYNI